MSETTKPKDRLGLIVLLTGMMLFGLFLIMIITEELGIGTSVSASLTLSLGIFGITFMAVGSCMNAASR